MPARPETDLLVGIPEIERYLLANGVAADLDDPVADGLEDTIFNFLEKKKVRGSEHWDLNRSLLATQQLMFREVGANPGAIDGLVGPDTLHALEQWQNLIRDVELPKKVAKLTPRTTWPREKDVEKFYGTPGTGHTLLELPYPMKIAWDTQQVLTKITIHSKCAESAGRVLAKVKAHYSSKEIDRLGLNLFGGCYNNRPKRGGTSKSMHAYACAIDFDPTRNQLRWGRDRARLALPSCDAWWSFWEEEGWISLGRQRNYDWMHVQAAAL